MNGFWEWLKERPNLMMIIAIVISFVGIVAFNPVTSKWAEQSYNLLGPISIIFWQVVGCGGCGLFIYGLILSGKKDDSDSDIVVIDLNRDSDL